MNFRVVIRGKQRDAFIMGARNLRGAGFRQNKCLRKSSTKNRFSGVFLSFFYNYIRLDYQGNISKVFFIFVFPNLLSISNLPTSTYHDVRRNTHSLPHQHLFHHCSRKPEYATLKQLCLTEQVNFYKLSFLIILCMFSSRL